LNILESSQFGWNVYKTSSILSDSSTISFNMGNGTVSITKGELSSIFRGLLANNGASMAGNGSGMAVTDLSEKDALTKYALALPLQGINSDNMKIASILASILTNPTEDQKLLIDSITSLLSNVDKLEKEGKGAASPELKKATDDLVQMVAALLITQAIPDLLKEGDAANIKNTFTDLNDRKTKIFLEYNEMVKPYYDEIKDLLAKNMALLQLNNIIAKNMMENEIAKLDPSELGKIIDKIRKLEKKSFEEDYILQQESKYHKKYMESANKILGEKMKLLMKDFTRRIYTILDNAGAVNKKQQAQKGK
jgi:hypothetical protein